MSEPAWWRPAVVLSICAVAQAGCGIRTPQAIQHDYARTLAPAHFETAREPVPQASVRRFKVRVYADRDYRSQTVEWERRVTGLLEHGSEVLLSQFGVALEPATSGPGTTPAPAPTCRERSTPW